ncbi:MAG TPA: hypothetical protein VE172_10855 [Stackebrandtia sp.]|uniref:hypothetical protein n=1 Tax=Stackebrandtia sp. TaxID=2023065 RepID=UPI002D65F802|nr:hypothetical protein [Stackebrandtia sp.]HZE39300.1 hypothetical protein [Stackebrandtia sp.]
MPIRKGHCGYLAALAVGVAVIGGCSVSVEKPSGSADCDRIAELTHGKAPAKVVPHRKLPLPQDVTKVSASIVKKGNPPSIGPNESSIGTRQSLVDNVVVVAALTTDVKDAERQTRSAITSDKLKVNGGSSGTSNGSEQDFSLSYVGDFRDGGVATYQCGDTAWVVVTDTLVPDFPDSADDPLPSCEEIAAAVPSKVYADPVAMDDYGEETDDKDGSTRTCGVYNKGDDYNLSGYSYVEMRRPELDPRLWYHRLEDMDGEPKSFAKKACISPDAQKLHALPGGPKGASYCADTTTSQVGLSAAMTVGEDYWVGVSHEDSDLSEKKLLDRSSVMLAALSKL